MSLEDRLVLERIVRASSSEVRVVERARIVLCAAEGRLTAAAIAERVGCAERTVKKWRGRYARGGIDGLRDAPRPGAPLTHGAETRALLIAKACTRPPATPGGARQERWTGRTANVLFVDGHVENRADRSRNPLQPGLPAGALAYMDKEHVYDV